MTVFNKFVQSLFPGEAIILGRHDGLVDVEKKLILQQVIEHAGNMNAVFKSDPSIDKRKYSFIKDWCNQKLSTHDVDIRLSQLMKLEENILLDRIEPNQEKEFFHILKVLKPDDYNFVKYYEISRLFRHYLQIRFRRKETDLVVDFLEKYRYEYEVGRQLNDKIHQATKDILHYYSKKKDFNTEWTDMLSSIFFNESNDGATRILAWIRLVFIANSSNDYSFLKPHFELFEAKLADCTFYSRRIMANFYSQYLLFYANMHDFDKAVYYGKLSIKLKNNDYLYYSNNLVAVLLKNKKAAEGLEHLKYTSSLALDSTNFHNKLTHVSYYIRALTDIGKPSQADSRGFVFYNVHKKEIFHYRWHLFFTAWCRAMIFSGKFNNIIKLFRSYPRLIKDETDQIYNQGTFPILAFILEIALYKAGNHDISICKKNIAALHQRTNSTLSDDAIEMGKVALGKEWEVCLPK